LTYLILLTAGRALVNVLRAIAFWQSETCIDFRLHTTEQQFIQFIGNDEGCWSTVGKDDTLGRQVVSIGKGCEHGFSMNSHDTIVMPPLGSTRTLSHQNFSSISTSKLAVTTLQISRRELNTYQLPYDVGSVMHYTPKEFSSYKKIPALTTVDPYLQQTMGQLEGPSFLDVMLLNLHYNCTDRCPRSPTCQNGGFVDSRDCSRCKCPSGYGGALCDTVQTSFTKHCGGELFAHEAVRRFDITIKQIGKKKTKQCFYHLKAPEGKRVLVNIIRVQGRCIEGCWEDGVEFKMTLDPRPGSIPINLRLKLKGVFIFGHTSVITDVGTSVFISKG
uniref:Metalloendopeptidase n=1 Tax=Angiostrongylus cantonensis TaxID=6313 RepID=A0A158PAM6_ANGCA